MSAIQCKTLVCQASGPSLPCINPGKYGGFCGMHSPERKKLRTLQLARDKAEDERRELEKSETLEHHWKALADNVDWTYDGRFFSYPYADNRVMRFNTMRDLAEYIIEKGWR